MQISLKHIFIYLKNTPKIFTIHLNFSFCQLFINKHQNIVIKIPKLLNSHKTCYFIPYDSTFAIHISCILAERWLKMQKLSKYFPLPINKTLLNWRANLPRDSNSSFCSACLNSNLKFLTWIELITCNVLCVIEQLTLWSHEM